MTLLKITCLFCLFSLSACAPHQGGQVGEEQARCDVVQSKVLDREEVSALGFSPNDILSIAEKSHTATLDWSDNSSTLLTVDFAFDDYAQFQVRDWVDEHGNELLESNITLDCVDIVELQMKVTVRTQDGALNESWKVKLQAEAPSSATFSLLLDELSGTLDVQHFAPAGTFDHFQASIELSVGESGISGILQGQASSDDGEISTSQYFNIGQF